MYHNEIKNTQKIIKFIGENQILAGMTIRQAADFPLATTDIR